MTQAVQLTRARGYAWFVKIFREGSVRLFTSESANVRSEERKGCYPPNIQLQPGSSASVQTLAKAVSIVEYMKHLSRKDKGFSGSQAAQYQRKGCWMI